MYKIIMTRGPKDDMVREHESQRDAEHRVAALLELHGLTYQKHVVRKGDEWTINANSYYEGK